MDKAQTLEIGLVLYPGAQQAAVLGLTDLFCVASRMASSRLQNAAPPLRVTHWHQRVADTPPVCIFNSAPSVPSLLSALILPPTLNEPLEQDKASALSKWLHQRHADGVILGSVCAGAFPLAATGIMAGRRMTTHWTYADLLQLRHTNIHVDADQLLIDDGDVITAGGLMAWTDLGLKLVDRLLGPTVMVEMSRMLVVDPPGREQRYYSAFSPRLTHGDSAILKVQHWLQATQAKSVVLPSLAARAGLEERTFMRRFRKATGMTTTEYCQQLRIGQARELLQFESTTIEQIAWQVGYKDTGAFRKIFTRIVGLSPSAYRQRFSAKSQGT
ncbi:GlxA family transcriptional regulator [Halomonas icarae]|uniref:Helix-turn-helix domain-containing protein n=1 Tax=Halomonas icarae TaxID=2691040 RepID=A0A7X4VY28_9GAMM|nr:helix-turn-helix domain-containing protein [Halomonas icarae]NAW12340.1 helix-turn-helix domain-containing protein [Halomonas icarae]